MPKNEENNSVLEMFDVSKDEQVGKVPLASVRFIPRIGERIFLPVHANWVPYTVVNVEYFIDYDPSTGEPSTGGDSSKKITLYVLQSK